MVQLSRDRSEVQACAAGARARQGGLRRCQHTSYARNSRFAGTLDILFENSERDSLPRTFKLRNRLSRQEQPRRARRSVSRRTAGKLPDPLFPAAGLEPAGACRVIPLVVSDSLILIFDVQFSPATGVGIHLIVRNS